VENIGPVLLKKTKLYRGTGCALCNYTGYKGRIAVHEILMISKKIQVMILRREPTEKIKKQAKQDGMKTLFENALSLVRDGITTIEEVMSILYGVS